MLHISIADFHQEAAAAFFVVCHVLGFFPFLSREKEMCGSSVSPFASTILIFIFGYFVTKWNAHVKMILGRISA